MARRRIKLTTLERNRLVLILRCAAWLIVSEPESPAGSALIHAIMHLGFDPENPVYSLAWEARDSSDVVFSADMTIGEWNILRLTDAAQRVERLRWP